MHRTLKDKKVLITAGPTWVPIDRVRVISNISSGLTGTIIAQHAARDGADVTLLLGPIDGIRDTGYGIRGKKTLSRKFKIIRFRYFDELRNLLGRQLRQKKYDIIIHAAAVSDYRPVKVFDYKVRSGKKRMGIALKPTPKIIDEIRRHAPAAFLVMFKLEVKKPKKELVGAAYKGMLRSKADLVVANNLSDIYGNKHKAYIVDAYGEKAEVATKEELASTLLSIIAEKIREGVLC